MCTPRERQAMLAKKGRRPNAKHDPSRGKSPLRIDGFKVGGALTRHEKPPEPEQITSETWRLLADMGPAKGDPGAPKRQAHGPKLGFLSQRLVYLTRTVQTYGKQPF